MEKHKNDMLYDIELLVPSFHDPALLAYVECHDVRGTCLMDPLPSSC